MNDLDPMLIPRSIAVVGASERPGSVGDQVMRQLVSGGFTGEIHPVNPGRDEVHGLASHPDLESLGRPVDLAVLAVANAHLEMALSAAAKTGARAAAIFASCHGAASDGTPLRARLADIAGEAGMPICGGNGMGFLNIEDRIRVCGFYQPPDLVPGGVTFLTHSGSLFSALLHSRRRPGFNLVVSTGIEINTTMDRYLEWALGRPSTRVIGLFLETIRDPGSFRAALTAADRADVPVVALKVGASARGREAVATHSEAIAGEDAVYEALFEAHGVHRVRTMDEMLDTLEVLSTGRRATAHGLGAVHDSGGERALLIDTAERVGVPLPGLGEEVTRRIAAVLDPGLEPANPVDAWGTGRDAGEVFVECLRAVSTDPAIGAVAFCVDLTSEEEADSSYSHAALTAAASTGKPVLVLGNVSSAVDSHQASVLRAGGVPVVEGTETGLRAIGHLLARHRRASLPPPAPRVTSTADPSSGADGEAAALGILAGYGIPVVAHRLAASAEECVEAAAAIGYPIAMKTASGIAHKTDAGGVILGIEGEGSVAEAYRSLSSLGPSVLVEEMAPPGVEIALGMIDDPQFGPVVLIAAGGTMIEVLTDRVAVLPPIDASRARLALDRLGLRPLLDGVRGRPPADVDSLADVIARFSELALDARGLLSAIDVNPVVAGPGGALAVDALMRATG